MKWKTLMVSAAFSSLLLTACGTTNNNANKTALRNQDHNNFKNVNYNTNRGYDRTNVNYNTNRDFNRTNVNYNTNRDYDRYNVNRNVTNVNNKNNRIAVADEAAEKIVSMREVEHANVLVTDHNAYVAARLANDTGNRLERDVERKIADVVKSTDRNINNVYVSVNPDFYTRTTSYANDIRNGHPVAGFFDEFNTIVRRTFPTAR
ncbi:YhcN/YlaJ family sporulation lipoprotein [Neobacillus niacini]|uniref:YhcN/YlaJ family sporulation lipoprotein n=1 Tax=Neobacillus niacini TaxID=86668 RepID=UPI0028570A6C|nr:YhcN/YlaJ family sporulation lipoprotein [Neobacillus niacini]MDR7077718.1 YhcN/YlaJ family sporulation lipoprotein [Neobacillus niacini]